MRGKSERLLATNRVPSTNPEMASLFSGSGSLELSQESGHKTVVVQ